MTPRQALGECGVTHGVVVCGALCGWLAQQRRYVGDSNASCCGVRSYDLCSTQKSVEVGPLRKCCFKCLNVDVQVNFVVRQWGPLATEDVAVVGSVLQGWAELLKFNLAEAPVRPCCFKKTI